jgi:hypothetical protein
LRSDRTKQALIDSVCRYVPFDINAHLPLNPEPFLIDSSLAPMLMSLLEVEYLDIEVITAYWYANHSRTPLTNEVLTQEDALGVVGCFLQSLETEGYIFCF